MEFFNFSKTISSWILLFPLLGAFFIFLLPQKWSRWIGLVTMAVGFLLSLYLPLHFQNDVADLQFVTKVPWIPSLGIFYALGVDGISLWLVLLTTFLGPLVVLCSWNSIKKHEKAFYGLLLFLQTGMLGGFLATDLFLFYIFFEAMLVPLYFLIGIWGGENRIYATMKFFIFTMAGSLFMLVGLITTLLLYKQQFGVFSADIVSLYNLDLSKNMQILLFLSFALSFAIKMPVFFLHTWLPDAHVEAPTAGSVLLAGVLLKVGGYGFLRFALPLFPIGFRFFTPFFFILGVMGIICGALIAMVQPDLKKLIAYSSVSHLGFVILGIFAFNLHGLEGSLYQMLSHGLSTGGLFLIVGMIYERRHTRMIKDFGGLAKRIPLFCAIFLLITFSSIGLPGLNGFIGEFLILLGTFQISKTIAFLGATGVVLGAVYMLWMFQRMAWGKISAKNAQLKDISLREGLILIPIVLLIILMGVYPKPFLRSMDASLRNLILNVERKQEFSKHALGFKNNQMKFQLNNDLERTPS